MKNYLIYAIRTIWELPQLILGVLLIIIYRAKITCKYKGTYVFVSPHIKAGISLSYITQVKRIKGTNIQHEWGHSRQSARLGPFYLILIGAPSIIHNMFRKCKNYYHFYTEAWADRLAGIKRY